MELSCPLGTTRRVLQETFPRKPNNKSFIDQACLVKMAGYWPRSFFCEFMDLNSVSVHKHAKKELGQYSTILTSHLVNNPYIQYYTPLYSTIHPYTALYTPIQHYTPLYSTTHPYTILFTPIQHCTSLHSNIHRYTAL